MTIFSIEYNDEPSCEHCGDLEPCTATVKVEDIYYCLDCLYADGEISDELLAMSNKLEVSQKIKWHQREIERLKEKLY